MRSFTLFIIVCTSFVACKKIHFENNLPIKVTEQSKSLEIPFWQDEFTGVNTVPNNSLWNTSSWFRYTYSTINGKLHTWNYDPFIKKYALSYLEANNTKIINNELVIESGHDYYTGSTLADFVSGWIESKQSFSYGYFEIEAKIPNGDTYGSAFWLVGSGQEIDIFEEAGWETNKFCTNIHRDNDNISYPLDIQLNYLLDNNYHKFGLYWGDGVLKWYLDHKVVRQEYNPNIVPNGTTQAKLVISMNMPDARANSTMINNSKINNTPFESFKVNYCRVYDKRPTNAKFVTLNNQANTSDLTDYTDWSTTWDKIIPGNFDGSGFCDLLFYDRNNGKALFASTNGNGDIITIQELNNWRTTWDIIVPGDFDNDNITDLLLYDSSVGEAHFHNSSGMGQSFSGWRTTWSNIVPGNFDNAGNTDLLFYDNVSGEAYKYKVYSNGGIEIIDSYSGWRSTWNIIVPGDFDDDNVTDLLLYDKSVGEAHFFNSSGMGQSFVGWRTTWSNIISGNFDDNGNTDLLFHDKSNGELFFHKVYSNAGLDDINSHNEWDEFWEIIVPGQFGSSSITDLLFYSQN